MSDLFKAFEKFLFRDISFVLGGSVLIGSVMYVFNKLPTGDIPVFKYFIWAGVSYAIGYSVQEVFTLLHLVRTKAGFPPNWLDRRLYRFFDRKWPESIKKIEYEKTYENAKKCLVLTKARDWLGHLLYWLFDRRRFELIEKKEYDKKYENAKKWLYQKETSERFRNDHERIESLKHIGTALGPCFLLAGFILFLNVHCGIILCERLLCEKIMDSATYEYVKSGGLIIFGLLLMLLGWLKVTQQSEYLIKVKSFDTTPTASLSVTDNFKIDSLDSK
jgi:hypothetical protein